MANLKTLDEIFGVNKNSKFLVDSEEQYRIYLSRLSKTELQNECQKQKVNPRDSRDLMTFELMREFNKHLASLSAAKIKPTVIRQPIVIKKMLS